MSDFNLMADQMFSAVQRYVGRAVADAIKAIPAGPPGERGEKGQDADPTDVDLLIAKRFAIHETEFRQSVDEVIKDSIAAIPAPKDGCDGKDADPELIEIAVAKAVSGMPLPKDGTSVTLEQVLPVLRADIKDVLDAIPVPAAGKDGVDGKSVTPEELQAEVQKAVAQIPAPKNGEPGKDGENVPLQVVSALVAGEVAKAVSTLPKAKDGEHGRDAAQIEILHAIDETRSYPRGTWAKHRGGLWVARGVTSGMAGWDCIMEGIASVDTSYDGERTFGFELTLSSGSSVRKTFDAPVLLDRGIWKDTVSYLKGDVVTYGGSTWVCGAAEPTGEPGSPGEKGWRLQVRKGRDGKDGLSGKKGDPGSPGKPGRDLTQMDNRGQKW